MVDLIFWIRFFGCAACAAAMPLIKFESNMITFPLGLTVYSLFLVAVAFGVRSAV